MVSPSALSSKLLQKLNVKCAEVNTARPTIKSIVKLASKELRLGTMLIKSIVGCICLRIMVNSIFIWMSWIELKN